MTRRFSRRRTLIGVAALAFGASGAVASGAFTRGSQGSLGDNWIQVAGADQTVTFSSLEQVDVGDSSSGGEANGEGDSSEGVTGDEGDGGDGGDVGTTDNTDGGTSEDGSTDDNTGGGGSASSTSVEVLVDPSAANGVNSGGPARWGGSIFNTKYVTGTPDGYLRGIRNDEINQNATTRIGSLTDPPPGDNVVFLVANVGSEENINVAASATVTMRLLYNGEISSDEQSSFKFPYRVLDTNQNTVSSGQDLATASGIELATGEMIELAMLIDTSNGASDLKLISGIQFFATE
jgi:hypothetical protein